MSYPWFKANLEKKFVLNNLKSIVKHNSLTMGKYCYELENKLKKILNMKYVVLTTNFQRQQDG